MEQNQDGCSSKKEI